MAAGLGFKDFTTGEVLTAADVDGYLMQGIWVFASAAARDAAVTSPQEGNFAFLKDTNTTTYYTGSAWTNLDTTGMVNPMTTTGDTIYSSSGSTPARLGIGTAGQVLRVNSGATAPEWATPAAGGGMTLLSTTTLSGASTTISGISGSYKTLYAVIYGVDHANFAGTFRCAPNGSTNITDCTTQNAGITVTWAGYQSQYIFLSSQASGFRPTAVNTANIWAMTIDNYSSTLSNKSFHIHGGFNDTDNGARAFSSWGQIRTASAITSLEFSNNAGNFNAGTVLLYGVN